MVLARVRQPIRRTRTDARRLTEQVPPDFDGSEPEFFIFRALERRGMVRGVDFVFQSSFLGGRTRRGGVDVDFLIFSPRLGIEVQSAFFHTRTSTQRANDNLRRLALEGQGLRVEFIDENEARNRPDEAVFEALAGTRGRGPIGA
jgi:very-short-patch-repair endonuclease